MKRLSLLLLCALSTSCISRADSVATVNGETIDRELVRDHTEATAGDNALRQLIDFKLVMQEATRCGLTVTDAEIQAGINERKAQDPSVTTVQTLGGVRYEALVRQTRYQIALDEIMTRDIKASEGVLKTWFASHAKYYNQPARVKLGILLTGSSQRASKMAAQLASKSKSFHELVVEQKKSTDAAGHNSQDTLPSLTAVNVFPPAIRAAIDKSPVGGNSQPVRLGEGGGAAYAIIRVVQRIPGIAADLSKMHARAEMDFKLEQVAIMLNKENSANPPFAKTVEQVKEVIASQQGGNPPYRSILDFINNTEVTRLLSRLRADANVEVEDPAYGKVGEEFEALTGKH